MRGLRVALRQRQRGPRLVDLRLVIPWLDAHQYLAGVDERAVLHQDLLDAAGNARRNIVDVTVYLRVVGGDAVARVQPVKDSSARQDEESDYGYAKDLRTGRSCRPLDRFLLGRFRPRRWGSLGCCFV